MKVLLAKGADVKAATTVIDYRARSAADNSHARRAIASSRRRPAAPRIRTSTSTTRRQRVRPRLAGPGRPARRQADAPEAEARSRSTRTIQPRRLAEAGADAAAECRADRGRRRTSNRSDARAASPRCTTPRVTDTPRPPSCSSNSGMDVNLPTEGDRSTPMAIAAINGQYDLVDGVPRARRATRISRTTTASRRCSRC